MTAATSRSATIPQHYALTTAQAGRSRSECLTWFHALPEEVQAIACARLRLEVEHRERPTREVVVAP